MQSNRQHNSRKWDKTKEPITAFDKLHLEIDQHEKQKKLK